MNFLSQYIRLDNVISLVVILCATILSITFHEMAHGYTAYLMGDNTAKVYGRLSLNPLKHIDWIGALCLAVFHFGWAKPVPINPTNFKDRKKGLIVVSIAGPFVNFIISFLSVLFITLISSSNIKLNAFVMVFIDFMYYMAILNTGLGIFNLIPFPPLDGSKILACFLKPRALYKFLSFERYGTIILFVCFAIKPIGNIISSGLVFLQSNLITLFIRLCQIITLGV